MDALEAIRTRRSIRTYTDEAVTEGEVRTLLEAAMQAPSAGNAQPWRFVV
ncbi:MAG: nitroreductase family protein, partial [Desulfovibrionaceae bacterium]